MSESMRIRGWRRVDDTHVHVPAEIEFRFCPKDMGHWRVDGERCPVCQSKIKTLVYSPASPSQQETT